MTFFSGGFFSWFWLPLFPLFIVYFISGVAETNRAPFDVAEGESEIVAGFHVEYSGAAFAMFFLGEYANMILIAVLTAHLVLCGPEAPSAVRQAVETLLRDRFKIDHTTLQLEGLGECAAVDCGFGGRRKGRGLHAVR